MEKIELLFTGLIVAIWCIWYVHNKAKMNLAVMGAITARAIAMSHANRATALASAVTLTEISTKAFKEVLAIMQKDSEGPDADSLSVKEVEMLARWGVSLKEIHEANIEAIEAAEALETVDITREMLA